MVRMVLSEGRAEDEGTAAVRVRGNLGDSWRQALFGDPSPPSLPLMNSLKGYMSRDAATEKTAMLNTVDIALPLDRDSLLMTNG